MQIEHDRGLDGHSDADVLTHAVIDALLGAAGLGDIGEHFPDSDERWRDADSIELLGRRRLAAGAGAASSIVNVDCTLIMEQPKLGAEPSGDSRVARRRARALRRRRVNVKASTGERIGFVGRGEGVAALAVACVQAPARPPSALDAGARVSER